MQIRRTELAGVDHWSCVALDRSRLTRNVIYLTMFAISVYSINTRTYIKPAKFIFFRENVNRELPNLV